MDERAARLTNTLSITVGQMNNTNGFTLRDLKVYGTIEATNAGTRNGG